MITARGNRSLTARVRRHRRGLAALAAGLAILTLGLALRPDPLPVAQVVVASRDLPAGHRVELADLALAPVPVSVVLPGAGSDPAPLVGQVIAAPLRRGELVSASRLVAAWHAGDVPAGAVPLPVRFADPDAPRWLTAGQRIDVLAARSMGEDALDPVAEGAARVVAAGATVLVLPDADTDTGALTSGPSTSGQAPAVLLAVTSPEALAIAGAQAASRLSYRLVPVTADPAADAADRGSP